ncbi:MAG: hypothetical protein F4Y46_04840 [Chloroflexi bacterium]|nr:hypothetical protein [Chloroflexota bacterium]
MTVNGERVNRQSPLESLREHHLDDVSGGDVFLGLANHGREFGLGHVRLDRTGRAATMIQRGRPAA